ncbi:MAG: PIN domain protein [Thermoplasmatota archaeon]
MLSQYLYALPLLTFAKDVFTSREEFSNRWYQMGHQNVIMVIAVFFFVKYRTYVDTSVIGGCFDKEFSEPSLRLFEEFKKGKKIAVISDLTIKELEEAPPKIKNSYKEIADKWIEFVTLSDDAIGLAGEYMAEGVLGKGSLADAQHIAIGTINRVDLLVSWNFKHVVNYKRIRYYNAINLKMGYQMIEIRTPMEVLDDQF